MRRTRTVLVVGLAVAGLAVAGCGGDDEAAAPTDTETTTETTTAPSGTTLMGSVGPGFEISLSTADGQPVETLTAGSYTVEVDDQSDIHNFHLTGTGVDEMTEVGDHGRRVVDGGASKTGRTTFRVRPARELDER